MRAHLFARIALAALGLLAVSPRAAAAVERGPDTRAATAGVDTAVATGNTVLLPVLGYTPDTGLMVGGLGLRFFYLDPALADARPSTFSPAVVYTLEKQIMLYLGFTLVGGDNRNELAFVPSYVHYPDQYYGVGRDVDLVADEEDFTSESFATEVRFLRRVWGNVRVGLNGEFRRHRLDEVTAGGKLAHETVLGTANTWHNTLGPAVSYDSRDNTLSPRHGEWVQAWYRFAGPALASDYATEDWIVDLRGYRTVGRDLILAGQFQLNSHSGDVPFFAMPRLGGDSGLRGYRGGLYRHRTRALGRLELRRDAVWGRVGAVMFAGIGDVARDPGALTLAGRLWTAGGGLRFMLDPDERINLRMDFGTGNGDSGFFLSLGEAF